MTSTGSTTNAKRKLVDYSDGEDLENPDYIGGNSSQSNDSRKKCKKEAEGGEEKVTAEQSVFSNDYLVWTILKHADFEDLKSFRQVNRLWCLEASKLLLNARQLQPLHIKNLAVALETYDRKLKITSSFQQFSQLVSESSRFPCYSLELRDSPEYLWLYVDSRLFFESHGGLFDKLKISRCKVFEAGLFTIEMYFGKLFPNLKSLSFDSAVGSGHPFAPKVPPNLTLVEMKKLKKLKFSQDIPTAVLERLLRISPNVEKICWTRDYSNSSQCNFLNSIVQLNATSLLKKVYFTFDYKSIKMYEKMLEQKPEFEEIEEICFDSRLTRVQLKKAGKVLTELLTKCCSQTVTKIEFLFPLGHVTHLEFPAFPKAEFVAMHFFKRRSHLLPGPIQLLPPGRSFSNIFPNLRELRVYFTGDEQMELETIFPKPINPLVTLKTMAIIWDREHPLRYVPTSWVKQFCEMFSNVTRAVFSNLHEDALEHLWKLGRLEELHFFLRVNTRVESYPKVDAAFTGFSEESVKELYCKQPNSLKMLDADIKALSGKPSIAGLKNLKKLRVRLVDEDIINSRGNGRLDKEYTKWIFGNGANGNLLSVNDNVIFSHVAKRFLIKMCPHYKNFTFKFNQERFSMDDSD